MLYLRTLRVSCPQLPFLTPLYITSSFEKISANHYHQLSQRAPWSSDSRQVSIQSNLIPPFLLSHSPFDSLHLHFIYSSLALRFSAGLGLSGKATLF
jgi:hypothetical protein